MLAAEVTFGTESVIFVPNRINTETRTSETNYKCGPDTKEQRTCMYVQRIAEW